MGSSTELAVVPPRSMVTVRRRHLPGQRFLLDCSLLTRKSVADLRTRGAAAALELIQSITEARPLLDVFPRRRCDHDGSCAGHMDYAIREAGLPDQIGVFLDGDERNEEGQLDTRQAVCLGPVATLAVLARRSGPLYLPHRPFMPSLIVPMQGLLVFPEE
jgi:hypothetical protein